MFTTTWVSGPIIGLPKGIPHCELTLPPGVLGKRHREDCIYGADPDERLVANGYKHHTW
jgi:hypothetical protein